MIALRDLATSLGVGLVTVVVPGPGRPVTDVTVVEPGEGWLGVPGDLVFGVGLADAPAAVELLAALGEVPSAGVVLRRQLARSRTVRAAARRADLALLEIAPTAALAHVLGLVRGILDRTTTVGVDPSGPTGTATHHDLFTIADAVAALVEGPVTIEDAQSRVLAYSSRQDVTDPARINTIVGRRVPAELVAHFRSRGLFRRLARSDEPFLVPPGPTQDLPRLVVPVRAGGEWLGSIWVVTSRMPAERVLRELRQVAAVLAIRLLRVRAESDLTRRVIADRLRTALQGNASGASGATEWLPDGPWRVVALGRTADSPDAVGDLDVWETVFRRHQWQRPLLTDDDGGAWALVTDPAPGSDAVRPGSWAWLRDVLSVESAVSPDLVVSAGSRATTSGGLPRSRTTAAEVARLRSPDASRGLPAALDADTAWRELALARATAALAGDSPLPGPLAALARHDESEGTAYLATLAAHLDHPGDPTAAAAVLHVHPNTLRYRLGRMAEVTDLGLDDPATRLVLRLHLLALGHPPSGAS